MTSISAAPIPASSLPSPPAVARASPTDRTPEADVDPLFLNRWSPRAFTDQPVTDAEVRTLFEAVRWAPSGANEQPWLFVYARTPEDRARFAEGLVEFNRMWASRAPLLLFVFARKFSRNAERPDQPNPGARFDTGAAWMSLALQAEILGLSAHAMGGIVPEKAFEVTGVPSDRFDAVIAVAVGHRGDPAQLPDALAARETPSPRLPQREIVAEGRFNP
jgi:nitroreductase